MKKTIKTKDSEGLDGIITISTDGCGGRPYWSITAWYGFGHSEWGGCCHDEIAKHHPELQIFIDLHLSEVENKLPMHAVDKGLHWMGLTFNHNGEAWEDLNLEHVKSTLILDTIEDAERISDACHEAYSAPVTAEALACGPHGETTRADLKALAGACALSAKRCLEGIIADELMPKWTAKSREAMALLAEVAS